ncbi:MAG: IS6 family transposase [Planctomycetes bacterium]|nr:IS6 family transposase [Planctomycetota bacterium]
MNYKGSHFPKDVILLCICYYLRYKLSLRDLEEIMRDRGIDVDHSTIGRWVLKYSPEIIRKAMHKKKTVGKRWRMDETYIKIRGKDAYLFRAVDKAGNTVDFYVSENGEFSTGSNFATEPYFWLKKSAFN